MEQWIQLADVVIWPVTIFTLVLIFKKEFRNIVTRVNNFKYKDLEASFNKELSIVEETTSEINKDAGADAEKIRKSFKYGLNRALRLAEVSPRAAISESWREVETATISLMHTYGYDPKNVQMSKVFRGIVHENGYPWSLYEDYRRMLKLRNRAVHSEEFELNGDESERYIRAAIDLAVFIKKLSEEPPKQGVYEPISLGT